MILVLTLHALTAPPAWTQQLGLYMNGQRIGTSVYTRKVDSFKNLPAMRTDSKTVMDAALLGTPVKMVLNSSTWSANNKPLKMTFDMTSSGRGQKIVALFGASTVNVDVNNSGSKSHKVLPLPKDGSVVDDPVPQLIDSKAPAKQLVTYVLDPTTVNFIKNVVKIMGPTDIQILGKKRRATRILIQDPRADMSVYMDGKSELVKIDGPMGIEMLPEPVGTIVPASDKPIDLADATRIATDRPIDSAGTTTKLNLVVRAKDLSRLPSDEHQTIEKVGDEWKVSIHPPILATSTGTIRQAAESQPAWVKPSLNIPSASPRFTKLASKIVGNETRVAKAGDLIRAYVKSVMVPNAGIGVLRDANDVLTTKEGVCRDYAILTATLLRASGIPARVASGLVYFGGQFYYHAWAEAYDGKQWLGFDSTSNEAQISAAHIKLADGAVEDAFAFTFLEGASIKVVDWKN